MGNHHTTGSSGGESRRSFRSLRSLRGIHKASKTPKSSTASADGAESNGRPKIFADLLTQDEVASVQVSERGRSIQGTFGPRVV